LEGRRVVAGGGVGVDDFDVPIGRGCACVAQCGVECEGDGFVGAVYADALDGVELGDAANLKGKCTDWRGVAGVKACCVVECECDGAAVWAAGCAGDDGGNVVNDDGLGGFGAVGADVVGVADFKGAGALVGTRGGGFEAEVLFECEDFCVGEVAPALFADAQAVCSTCVVVDNGYAANGEVGVGDVKVVDVECGGAKEDLVVGCVYASCGFELDLGNVAAGWGFGFGE
jgi:hypothetical protein